jgi:hypothetical protein
LEQTDPNTGKTTTQESYILPEQKMIVTIMLEKKQYMRIPFGDEFLAMMKKQNNDPRVIIKKIMACEYTELGRSVIDGVEVEGFRTTDPAAFLSALEGDPTSTERTLWVDAENWLPFRSEWDIKYGEKKQISSATYDYHWNVPVQAGDFDPYIPEDFKPHPTDGMKTPGMNEADGIEGLKLFAEITGRYPKKLNMMDLGQEIAALAKDFQNLPPLIEKSDELKKLKDQMSQNSELSEEEIFDTLLKTTMEIVRPLHSIGFFYMMLVADQKEPVYYGESVGPDDADKVLLKWKVSDDQYRVIFGDLTAEDLTAEQWNEFEK